MLEIGSGRTLFVFFLRGWERERAWTWASVHWAPGGRGPGWFAWPGVPWDG